MGERDGPVRLWERGGKRLLYAEYTRKRKAGLVCLFRDGVPWLIQEWDKGSVLGQYLVKFKEGVPEAVPDVKLSPEEAKEALTAQQKLVDLEAEIKTGEADVKKAIREVDKRIKQELVAEAASARRARQRDRQAANQAAASAKAASFWRGVLERGVPY
jgi:hypothetical protein